MESKYYTNENIKLIYNNLLIIFYHLDTMVMKIFIKIGQ